jgi:hypothetical protein
MVVNKNDNRYCAIFFIFLLRPLPYVPNTLGVGSCSAFIARHQDKINGFYLDTYSLSITFLSIVFIILYNLPLHSLPFTDYKYH